MNPQQNQNNQPDYGFIVNQPNMQAPKKGLPKPMIALGVVLVFGLIAVIAVVLFVPKNNVTKIDQTAASQSEATETAKAYLSSMGQNNVDDAYGLLSASAKEEVSAAFFAQLAPQIFNNIDTASCQPSGSPKEEQDFTSVSIVCKTKAGDANAEIVFDMVSENQTTKIKGYEILATNKEPQNG